MDAAQGESTDASLGPPFTEEGVRGLSEMQLDVLRGMLSSLETLTDSGQRYTMAKMVAFIRRRVPASALVLSPRNAATVGDIVDRLERETTGMMVNADRFVACAGTLLDLLEAVAWQPHSRDREFRTDRTKGGLDQRALLPCD